MDGLRKEIINKNLASGKAFGKLLKNIDFEITYRSEKLKLSKLYQVKKKVINGESKESISDINSKLRVRRNEINNLNLTLQDKEKLGKFIRAILNLKKSQK